MPYEQGLQFKIISHSHPIYNTTLKLPLKTWLV